MAAGLKEIREAGQGASGLIDFGLAVNSFVNVWGEKHDTLKAAAGGKNLTTLTDEEIKTLLFAGLPVPVTVLDNSKLLLAAVENFITQGRAIKDTLPANDLE